MPSGLRGRSAAVTGSSSGRGRAIALARAGGSVVRSDIRPPALEG